MINFLWGIIGFLQSYNGAVTAVATVFIAAFTVVLAFVTNRQAKLTKIIAGAAKRSADAAVGVELPKLLVRKFDLASGHFSTYDSVEITVINYGRTPAYIYWESAEYRVGPTLPPEPDYRNGVDREPGTIIEGGDIYKLTARGTDGTSVFLRAPFDGGEQTLWIYGIIYYRDFLGEKNVFQCCARLYAVRGEREVPILRFIQDGPDAYTTNAEKK
jgi:hypothetical protein